MSKQQTVVLEECYYPEQYWHLLKETKDHKMTIHLFLMTALLLVLHQLGIYYTMLILPRMDM